MDKQLKILYILTSAGIVEDSVQKKVSSQISFLNTESSSCNGAFFSFDINTQTRISSNINLIPIAKPKGNLFNKLKEKKATFLAIIKYLENNAKNYDIIYFRYFGSSKYLLKIAQKFKHKLVFEIQGINIDEIKSYKLENPFKYSLSSILSYYQFYYNPLWQEKIYLKRILNYTTKNICISKEIANFHFKISAKNYLVISNSIDAESYPVKKYSSIINNEINFLFLKGTTTLAPWNGIDRIINAIKNYKGKYKIKLYVVGHYIESEIEGEAFIEHLGYLSYTDLDEIFDKCHLGIGTLSLFRKNLNEASPLKTREYFARGLPFIYAYNDTDISLYPNLKVYSLVLPNDNSIIDIEKIINFCINKNNLNTSFEMHQMASKYLSIRGKMKQIVKFLS